jgi:pimeloyl-ACP methyl ester carboxylesterase
LLRYFTTVDGARIAYEDEGFGRPLLLLHGFMANRAFFKLQKPLADRFRLIAVDLRGHGASARPGERVTVEQIAADVTGLAEELDLDGAIGLGWSLGASVLWHVLLGPAARRFGASVVVDMTPRVKNGGGWSLGLSKPLCDARSHAIETDFTAFASAAGRAIFTQPVSDEMEPLATWASDQFTHNDPATMRALWESLVGQDMRPLLGSIRQPSLVARGAHSHLYGAETADYLAAVLPDATLRVFEGSGHAPILEEPALFNQTVREFAANLGRVRENQIPA